MTRKEMVTDYLIIGDGLVAKYLLKRIFEVNGESQCLQLASEELAPSCTLKTTAVITRNGIEKGISPLGDHLVNALSLTTSILANAPGFENVTQTFMAQGQQEVEQLKRRFKDSQNIILQDEWATMNYEASLICPEILLPWLEKDYKKHSSYSFQNDFVTSLVSEENEWKVQTHNGKSYCAKKVFLCTGAYGKFISLNDYHDETLQYTKPVSGSYLTCRWDGGDQGFVYSFKGFNLIYRSLDKTVMIGGDTDNNFVMAPHFKNMHKFYNLVKKQIGAEYSLPDFENFEVKTGLRHKGQRRRPFWGRVDNELYAIHSLYKNGYTLGFLAVEDILKTSGILNS